MKRERKKTPEGHSNHYYYYCTSQIIWPADRFCTIPLDVLGELKLRKLDERNHLILGQASSRLGLVTVSSLRTQTQVINIRPDSVIHVGLYWVAEHNGGL